MDREYLKYKLAFIKKYADRSEIKRGKQLTDKDILDQVHKQFTFASKEELEIIQSQIKEMIEAGLNPKVSYRFMKEKFNPQLVNIFSNNLYHFTSTAEYLESALRDRIIYPSFLNIYEYVDNNLKRRLKLEDNDPFEETFREIQNDSDILKQKFKLQKNKTREDWQNKMPFYSCFTEMPETSLPFHAHHYGFYGISFKKNNLLVDTVVDRSLIGSHTISPVLYVDPNFCNYQDLLLEKIINTTSKSTDRRDSLENLLRLKPIDDESLLPENFYSVYFEREWRYISSSRPFNFKIEDIEAIFLPHVAWESANTAHERTLYRENRLKGIIDLVAEHNIKVLTIKNELWNPKLGMPRYGDFG